MKKVISVLAVCLLTVSCMLKTEPIEKYKTKGIVVIENPKTYHYDNVKSVRCKTKDSIFYIAISDFDAKNLKVGDTIK